jgi:hypothetical protein
VDRCALFVDAGYVLADGAMAVHGTRRRDSVSFDYPGLLKLLAGLSRDRTGLPLLRCYWYEATVEGRRTPEHDGLADLPGLKLRLGRMRPGHREGVETEIHRDLITLARNGAVCDAIIVSAEEDLGQVIAEVQDLGVRVILLHITTDGTWTISRALRQECDDVVEISGGHLRPFVDLIAGAEPAGLDEHYPNGGYPVRALANGNGSGHAALTRHGLPAAALPAGPAIYPDPAAAYPGPAAAEYHRRDDPADSSPQRPGSQQGPGGLGGMQGPMPGDAGMQAQVPDGPAVPGGPSNGGVPGSSSGALPGSSSGGMPSSSNGQPGRMRRTQNGGPSILQASVESEAGAPQGQPQTPGELPGRPGMQDPLQNQGYSGISPQVESHGYLQNQRQAGPPGQSGGMHGRAPVQGQAPMQGQPGAGGSGLQLPARPGRENELPAGHGQRGYQHGDPLTGRMPSQDYEEAARPAAAPPPAHGRQPSDGSTQHYLAAPAGGLGPAGQDQLSQRQYPGARGHGQAGPMVAAGQSEGRYSRPQPAPAPVPQPVTVSLTDAVQAAHAEGFSFGDAVARDAPALWLEAVLARKPRMPSDLEARLLQGSGLPVDSLLHDEVRHALRRGFWDALERSRR